MVYSKALLPIPFRPDGKLLTERNRHGGGDGSAGSFRSDGRSSTEGNMHVSGV
jgi:hypothetical protein